ncbi:MAG TPA: hypothetical protein VI299_00265 [Polyangiales bacterium]
MSNIAGKAYAMNLVTPIRSLLVPFNKLIFWAVGTRYFAPRLDGLLTLSMIHYARWVILRDSDFPRLSAEQPKEKLKYGYMLFFSNFNGSWEQYVDSFSAAIPSGLNLLWKKNVGWPESVPEQPFHRYVEFNQIWTDYYYSAYPMAASNDVKAAQRVKDRLSVMIADTKSASPEQFIAHYHAMLKELQGDLSPMDATPIVSLAAEDIAARRRDKTHTEARKETEAEVSKLRANAGLSGPSNTNANNKEELRRAQS